MHATLLLLSRKPYIIHIGNFPANLNFQLQTKESLFGAFLSLFIPFCSKILPEDFTKLEYFFLNLSHQDFTQKNYLIKDEYDIRYSENIVLINKIIQLLNKINGPFSQVEFLNYQLSLIEAQILKLYPKTDFSAET